MLRVIAYGDNLFLSDIPPGRLILSKLRVFLTRRGKCTCKYFVGRSQWTVSRVNCKKLAYCDTSCSSVDESKADRPSDCSGSLKFEY